MNSDKLNNLFSCYHDLSDEILAITSTLFGIIPLW